MDVPRRSFLRADGWEIERAEPTDQQRGLPRPDIEKPCDQSLPRVPLPAVDPDALPSVSVVEAIGRRQSRRRYADTSLELTELSFLLWATQGIRESGTVVKRTVPSAGARHPFETYLLVNRVTGVESGLYRYLSRTHELAQLSDDPAIAERLHEASHRQFALQSAITFVWTALPYRTEWRYAENAPKLIALDAGHVCQNLYLAAEAVGAGVCAIAAYKQSQVDAVLGVDGVEEFAVYLATVGAKTEPAFTPRRQ